MSAPQTAPAAAHEVAIGFVVGHLAKMLLPAANGDARLAREAAFRSVAAHGPTCTSHLIAIGSLLAFGLAAIAAVSESMDPAVGPALAVRLRSSANALNRSAEAMRAVIDRRAQRPPPPAAPPERDRVADFAAMLRQSGGPPMAAMAGRPAASGPPPAGPPRAGQAAPPR